MSKLSVPFLPLIGEFLGTFLFILSILITGSPLMIGIFLALIIYILSDISGGHVNPAVSLAFFLKGDLSPIKFITYVVVQLLGATASLYTFNAFA
jgi:glycerol uptake facilitator-like aquaporin